MARGASKAHRQQTHKARGHAMELWRMRSKVKKKKNKRKIEEKWKKTKDGEEKRNGKKAREKR
jgi:hypothetical protein